ncbi:hypothetical protein M9Y10_022784 [Tritrichomonas musculus]|uniref:NET domain-containing protein n=1 Tax=Tritrichomonas musculus TaxID=1915356 RepID=A0ABR2KTE6_9EUKA
MDPISQTKCAYIYDTVITSPLGTEVIKFFMDDIEDSNKNKDHTDDNNNNNKPNESESVFLLQIRDNLDENKYPTPQSFIEEVNLKYSLKARDYGTGSDISLCLLTLLQLITEKFEKCFPKKDEKPLFDELDSFIDGFDELGKVIPNDRKSFIKFYNTASQAGNGAKRPVRPSKFQIADQKIDVEELYKKVIELKTDKDFEKVVDIIVSHEPSYSHSDNIVEIDLYKCQPYTLKLIKNYVDSQNKEEEENSSEENNKSENTDE